MDRGHRGGWQAVDEELKVSSLVLPRDLSHILPQSIGHRRVWRHIQRCSAPLSENKQTNKQQIARNDKTRGEIGSWKKQLHNQLRTNLHFCRLRIEWGRNARQMRRGAMEFVRSIDSNGKLIFNFVIICNGKQANQFNGVDLSTVL
jgi:hypothetical protein